MTTDIRDIINCGGVSGSDFRGIEEMDLDDILILMQEVRFRVGAGELSDVLQVVETVVIKNLQNNADELRGLETRLEVLEEKNSELIDTLSNIRNELENMLDVHKTMFTELTYKINDVIRENE